MKTILFLNVVMVLIVSLILHCDVPDKPSEASSCCNQLAGSKYIPVTIGTILCTARDSSGVYYVVDKVNSEYRCFISNDSALVRCQVLGSSTIGEKFYFLSLQDTAQIIFKNDAGKWSDAFFLRGEKCSQCDSLLNSHLRTAPKNISSFDSGWVDVCSYLKSGLPYCSTLETVTGNEINNFPVANFSPTTFIEYLAHRQTDQYLLVTRPAYDWNGDVVIHYGLAHQMVKCPVTNFLRASDGGSTWIDFVLNGKKIEAFFGVKWTDTSIGPGPSFLKIDSDTIPLERVAPSKQLMSDLGFDCPIEMRWYSWAAGK